MSAYDIPDIVDLLRISAGANECSYYAQAAVTIEDLRTDLESMREQRDAARAEAEALRADAERYRWWRDKGCISETWSKIEDSLLPSGESFPSLDIAIDAARKGKL